MMTPLEALEQFCPDERLERAAAPACAKPAVAETSSETEEEDDEATAAPSEDDGAESASSSSSQQQPQDCYNNNDDDVVDDKDDEDEIAPSEFVCPLTLQIMRDPVLSRYGQNYERAAILQWLARHSTCPLTRRPLELRHLIGNPRLRLQIRQWQLAHSNFDVQRVLDSPFDDDDDFADGYCLGDYGEDSGKRYHRVFGYCLIDWNDGAERSGDDPRVILEYRPNADSSSAATRSSQQPQQRPARRGGRRRRGWLGRLRRAVAARA